MDHPPRNRMAATAAAIFLFTWIFRFNDPNGGFAGLTDDHFFYLLRGWQILFGELPVRDFVDHGAPLYFYVSAAVQVLFGRGTLSELIFSTTMIATGATMTFWLAARAAGSIAAGLLGAAFAVLITPRFYNYPKILVYAVAIPLLWAFLDRPGRRPIAWLAALTVVGFLFRHDHGVFVALLVAAAIVVANVSWQDRGRLAVRYGALVLVLAAPYLVFLQLNGGVITYIREASAWSQKERARTPIAWPGLFDNPEGISENARTGDPLTRAVTVVRDNRVAWTYYVELLLPFTALAVLALSRDGLRASWPRAVSKLSLVALLGLVLDAGFLRSPLDARLADPSVPHAILIAWLAMALPQLVTDRSAWRPTLRKWTTPATVALVTAAGSLAFVLGSVMTYRLYDRFDDAYLLEGPRQTIGRMRSVVSNLREDWNPATWPTAVGRSELFTLSLYLTQCTAPTDRVFVQSYIPQVLALARRGFAAGFGDLRPGFDVTPNAQALALQRIQRQQVPVALLATDDSLTSFREDFPLLTAYFDTHYEVVDTHIFGDRVGITVLVHRDASRTRTFEPLGWPCPAPQ